MMTVYRHETGYQVAGYMSANWGWWPYYLRTTTAPAFGSAGGCWSGAWGGGSVYGSVCSPLLKGYVSAYQTTLFIPYQGNTCSCTNPGCACNNYGVICP